MSLLLGLALAVERGPGTWEIGANPAGQGQGWASVGLTQIGVPGRTGYMLLPGGELFYAPTDTLAVQVRAQVGPVFADDGPYPLAFGTIGARWMLVDRPGLKLAPTLGSLGVRGFGDGPIGGAALGVALQTGAGRWHLDLSWPMLGFAFLDDFPLFVPPWAGLLVTEVGLTLDVGPHSIRVGTTAWFPMVTLRVRPDGRFFMDVSVGGAPEFGPTAGLQAGFTFGD